MNISRKIENKIDNLESANTFTYKDFSIKKEGYFVASKSDEEKIITSKI